MRRQAPFFKPCTYMFKATKKKIWKIKDKMLRVIILNVRKL